MDSGLMIKELASQLGVTEDTVINWEIRGIRPVGRNLEKLKEILVSLYIALFMLSFYYSYDKIILL